MTARSYPLAWPAAFPRTAKEKRQGGAFKTSLAGALANVQNSLKLFSKDSGKALGGLVISSNVTLGDQLPADSGVSVWFTWDGLQVCIPIDRYSAVEANLQAIHHVIEARRTELRHGGLAIVRATFSGFSALPSPERVDWIKILGVSDNPTLAEVERAYKTLRSSAHPDKGGDSTQFHRIEKAWEIARQELRA